MLAGLKINWWKVVLLAFVGLIVALGLYLGTRFLTDRPVEYDNIEQHFKYGSLGGERNLGIPYWLWKAVPELCPDLLPNRGPDDIGLESIGMVYEPGRDLPVGVSMRRHLGIDRVFMNCAVCHSSTVRDSEQGEPRLILGMPANRFRLMEFEKTFFSCMSRHDFNSSNLIPLVDSMGAELDLIDRYLVYPIAIWMTRERLSLLETRLGFFKHQPEWGPGRVDTFNAAKAIFNWDWSKTAAGEMIGTADFPSVWNQGKRKVRDDGMAMELHWDGNNDAVEERNLSAAFGAGATPTNIDHGALARIEDWLLTLPAPPYPYAINRELAAQGKALYLDYCAGCHGQSGSDFSGSRVGHVEPIEHIGTDRWRLDSYTAELARNQATLYATDEQYRFKRFHKTQGYANMPLDGIWLRSPFLHNGSVPTLRDLLEPASGRPAFFYRGNDIYDRDKLGFVSNQPTAYGRPLFGFDVSVDGNGNQGHEGARYGTELSAQQKDAIVEYLKTF
ncbi:cytochrome c [Alteromonas aestuariivivens]|uniref:Cytochrome c n=1 Tax=Alteromonas aestuariivivens TaxID=1938339 RepID=A0A3D8M4N7_9ALTE|nr:cytochrome c [Alteromonas aestuariivivens]RDV24601.1 cytochrome c [Alteromonas aestuariivivens]